MIEAAPMTPSFTPSTSCAQKPCGMKGVKWAALNAGSARMIKPARATSLTMTSTKLTRALSRVPSASRPATSRAMTTAGRLTMPPASGPLSSAWGASGHQLRIRAPA